MSVSYPLVRKRSDFSTRRGVSRRPSRLGFSPRSASRLRIVSCMLAFYLALAASAFAAIPQAAAAPTATTPDPWATADPDALYSQRADILKAKQAAEVWARRLASGKDYEAALKLARACYYLGTVGPKNEQDYELDRGVTAGQQAAALDPKTPEGHFWYAANMGEKAQRGSMFTGLKYKGSIKSELESVVALGEWYLKVPGFAGGDHDKGVALLRKALAYNPESSHVRYSLAEALSDDSKTRPEVLTLLQQVIDAPIDPNWAAEDQNFKQKSKALLDKLNKK
jgi:hypothetical protein